MTRKKITTNKPPLEVYLYVLTSYSFGIPVSRCSIVCLPAWPSVCVCVFRQIYVKEPCRPGYTGDSGAQCFCHTSRTFTLLLLLRSFFTRLKFSVHWEIFLFFFSFFFFSFVHMWAVYTTTGLLRAHFRALSLRDCILWIGTVSSGSAESKLKVKLARIILWFPPWSISTKSLKT